MLKKNEKKSIFFHMSPKLGVRHDCRKREEVKMGCASIQA